MRRENTFVLGAGYTNILTTTAEVKDWVAKVEKMPIAEKIASMRTTFFKHDFDDLWQRDPRSPDYINHVIAMFSAFTDRAYDVADEQVGQRDIKRPYPFATGSAKLVSENLLGVSTIIGALPVDPPARILEMGCGGANSGLNMARMGYDVTCLDIDPSCADVIDHWAPRFYAQDRICFVESSFETVDKRFADTERFDTIVFFKSFHHCPDPIGLLRSCHELLKPGGSLLLVAESIHGNFYVPWGLRCDGMSVWAIIKNGWMELGFDTEFFDEVSSEEGFELTKRHRTPENPTMNFDLFKRTT